MRYLAALILACFAACAGAEWAMPASEVPMDRLIKNCQSRLRKNPKDAEAAYHLGRLHSMIFAEHRTKGYESRYLPWFGPWMSVQVERRIAGPLSKEDVEHLRQSLIWYHTAQDLAPDKGLYSLGLAWMVEQASKYASQVGAIAWMGPGKPTKADLEFVAFRAYMMIYLRYIEHDLKAGTHLMDLRDFFLSEEAGRGLLRLAGPGPTKLEPGERAAIEANVKKLKYQVMGITPIIVPLTETTSFASLTSTATQVRFDLVGDGMRRTWPWIAPTAGFLVWYPAGTGKVRSGRQLFGSSTFWLLFKDGYAALASLDDDHDGRLTGRELRGIAIWQDRNSNGVSEPGEVTSIRRLGVIEIKTKGQMANAVLTAAAGLVYADGHSVPTYDWVPNSR